MTYQDDITAVAVVILEAEDKNENVLEAAYNMGIELGYHDQSEALNDLVQSSYTEAEFIYNELISEGETS